MDQKKGKAVKKTIVIILLLAMAGAAIWYFFFYPKTDEELIGDRLRQMTQLCSKRSGEGAVVMAMKNSGISNHLASSCSVSIKQAMIDGTFKPLEFAGQISRARTLFSTLSGSISDIEVEVDPDGKNATVEYSARVRGTRKESGSFDEVRDLRSKMIKEDGKWKFASFEVREILER